MASTKSNHYDVIESNHCLKSTCVHHDLIFIHFRTAFVVSLALIFKLSKMAILDAVLKY